MACVSIIYASQKFPVLDVGNMAGYDELLESRSRHSFTYNHRRGSVYKVYYPSHSLNQLIISHSVMDHNDASLLVLWAM